MLPRGRVATEEIDERFSSQLQFPNNHPAVEGLISDDRCRLWAKVRVEPGKAKSHYWIVDPHKRTVVRAEIRGDVDLRVVQQGHAYGILKSPTGEHAVVRYGVGI